MSIVNDHLPGGGGGGGHEGTLRMPMKLENASSPGQCAMPLATSQD